MSTNWTITGVIIVEVIMSNKHNFDVLLGKQERRKRMAEKRHFEDTLFLLGVFVLLIIIGQVCLKYGWVIWLD